MSDTQANQKVARRLAAILAADIAGYSALMGANEEATVGDLKAHQMVVLPMIGEYGGRVIDTAGDGILAEFGSVVNAVECALAIQKTMAERNTNVQPSRRMQFRMGINLGDLIHDDARVYGDGVNIAARLEAIAEPGGICISAVVHDQVRKKLPLTFTDLGAQSVKNIAEPIRVYRIDATQLGASVSPTKPALTLLDKPSIAVLAFNNMSGESEQEYFSDGISEDVITDLSKLSELHVIARNSSFTYKGKAVDVKQVGRELGVRYVLEGSVRKAGGRIRITAQLVDATNGTHLWADRFDGSLADVFELQDKVALSVAGVIEPELQVAETARSAHRPTDDLTAYDLYLRAFARGASSAKHIPEAVNLLEEAIERDPRYGPALAWAAVCRLRRCLDGWSKDPKADSREAIDLARRALQVASDDPGTLGNAAISLAFFGEDINAATSLVDHTLALNPSFARGWYLSGLIRWWAGQPDLAIEHIEVSLRLSPRARSGWAFYVIGGAHFVSRRFDDAVPKLLLAIQEDADFPPPYRYLAACYAHMERLEAAREVVARLRTVSPLVVPKIIELRNAEHRELYLSGLRLAAGEET